MIANMHYKLNMCVIKYVNIIVYPLILINMLL